MRKTQLLGSYFLLGALAVGCSILNAPADLLPPDDGDSAGDGDVGGAPGDGDTTGDGDAPGDGDTSETGGTAGDGDAPVPVAPTTGLIVVAAEEETTGDRLLVVLDAANGNERSREALNAVSVGYDEAPGRFAWFVFSSSKIVPSANTLAELQVRRFDDETNTWTTLSSASSLPPPLLLQEIGPVAAPVNSAAFHPVVLNNRLVYLSQIIDGGVPVQAITVLDTTDLQDVTVIDSIPLTNPATDPVFIVGLVGRRGTELNAESVGGSVSVMAHTTCDAGSCQLEARPFTIGKTIAKLASDSFGASGSSPAFATSPILPDDVERPFQGSIPSLGGSAIFFRPAPSETNRQQFDPSDPSSKGAATTLDGAETPAQISGFAVSECLAAGVAAGSSINSPDSGVLYGIHLATALTLATPLDHPPRDVLIEPFRSNAITLRGPISTGAPVVRAFQIEGIGASGSESISLTERSVWNAPTDLNPFSFAVRLPADPACN